MSVAGLLVSIESNMGGVRTHATAATAGLQGTQLFYDEDLVGSIPTKTEREGGLGSSGFRGGGGTKGVSSLLLSPENVRGSSVK
jgi:hypothetical protein